MALQQTLSPVVATVSHPEPNTIALEGEIDMHESPNVREAFREVIAQKLPRVFVDLSNVSYIDSSGIAVLIEAMQSVHTYGGQLALFGIRENVRTVFEIARLDQVFKIFPDQQTALAG